MSSLERKQMCLVTCFLSSVMLSLSLSLPVWHFTFNSTDRKVGHCGNERLANYMHTHMFTEKLKT